MRSPRPAPRARLGFALRLFFGFALLIVTPGWPVPLPVARVEPAQAAALNEAKIAPMLRALTAGGAAAEFLVVLAQQADLSGAEALPTKSEKGRYVYDVLRKQAQATQGPLIAWLKAQHVAFRPYYIVNMLWVKGGAGVLAALAQRPEVARIDGNPNIAGQLNVLDSAPAAPAASGVEPNIHYVHADALWALGFTGQGVVVGGQDTGYDWNHPALMPHYRGWDGLSAKHDYNWHDSIHSGGGSCGADSPEPCDDEQHGTHTMGTAVGDDGAGNQVGMAPGAQWIGCRNMNQNFGTPATYIECFQFFLAPYPIGADPLLDGDPAMAPDVTTNSWSCPALEGCNPASLQAALQAQQAAGILTVVAATNGGHTCSTISDPPSLYAEAYTVGALTTGTDSAASFSSLGPVTADGSNRRKPDIAAPGTSIRSSIPGGFYSSSFSGTSMATPHVAGAIALLWSAAPALRGQISQTEQIFNDSAVHIDSTECGSSGWPNNVYGYGRLDVEAALDLATAEFGGVLSGTVKSSAGLTPISGAALCLSHGPLVYTATTAAPGSFQMAVLSDTYTLTVSAFGYMPATLGGINLNAGITTTLPITLQPALLIFLPMVLGNGAQVSSAACGTR